MIKNKTMLGAILVLGLFFAAIANAQDKYLQISDQKCDSENPCKEGLECISFPETGSRCAKQNPCSYYNCAEGTNCLTAESYPLQVICRCTGADCPIFDNAGDLVSYDLITKTSINTVKQDKTTSSDILLWKSASGSRGMLETKSTSARYSGELVVENSNLYMKTSAGKKQISILPEDAASISKADNVKGIELKEESSRPVYSIKSSRQVKVLFIPVRMEIEAKVDAQTGNKISVNKPWWGFLASESQQEPMPELPPMPNLDEAEMTQIPQDVYDYSAYKEAISGRTGQFEQAYIEGTVLSIAKFEVCPYNEENCRIEPYPKDTGIVRIDKIIVNKGINAEEQPSSQASQGVQTTAPSTGVDLPSEKPKTLSEGMEVPAIFLLTARPSKARYTPAISSPSGMENSPSSGLIPESSETDFIVSQTVTIVSNEYTPVKKEKVNTNTPTNEFYYVFTTKTIMENEPETKVFEGLDAGDKFSAEVTYDGRLYVEEYSILSNI